MSKVKAWAARVVNDVVVWADAVYNSGVYSVPGVA